MEIRLTDMEISREEFINYTILKEKEEFNAIIREKQKYERMKQNVKNIIEKQENMRLNSMISKNMTSFSTCDSLKINKHFAKSKKNYFPFLSYFFFFFFFFFFFL